MTSFDVVVIGCGPGGERAAILAAREGKRVAVIECANVVGGARINWGTIPSKTLRESAIFVQNMTRRKLEGTNVQIPDEISISDIMYRERMVVQQELELINDTLDRYKIEVFHGFGRFVDPHTVTIVGANNSSRAQIQGDFIVIATGTKPNHPTDIEFDGEFILDSDSVLKMKRMPRSMIVLGAGVIGVEYASIFAALGLEVTLIDTRDRLLPYLDREIAHILERELKQLGMMVFHDDHYESITIDRGDRPGVVCKTRGKNQIEAEVMLYAVGRDGNTRLLGLDAVGLKPNSRGLLEVNDQLQTVQPHIYAVGDVIGYPALASTSMAQGRRAIRNAFDLEGPSADANFLPYAIYSIPEVSYFGETEEELQQKNRSYVVGRGQYGLNPRGQILGETGGLLKLLFDTETEQLLGVHIVGHNASELIHNGQTLMQSGATALQIAEMLFNYPTLSDLFRHAALEAHNKLSRS